MADVDVAPEHPSRVLISSTRKPVSYLNTCKRNLAQYGEVHLSALGVAISSLVTVAEILKVRELAVEQKVATMLAVLGEDAERSGRQKPKMEVILVKSPKFDEVMAAEAATEAATQDTPAETAPSQAP